MQKSIYYAISLFLLFLALQCVCVEKVEFRWSAPTETQQTADAAGVPIEPKPIEYTPPDWLIWSLFTPGLIFFFYAYSSKN